MLVLCRGQSGFNPALISGLGGWFSAGQFVGYTNGQPTPPNWTDETGRFTATNNVQIGALPSYNSTAINGAPGVYFTINGGATKEIYTCSNAFPAILTNVTLFFGCRDMLQDGQNETAICVSSNRTQNGGFFMQSYLWRGAPDGDAGDGWFIDTPETVTGEPQTMGGYSADFVIVRYTQVDATSFSTKVWINGVVAYDSTILAGGTGGANLPIPGVTGIVGNLFKGSAPDNGIRGWQGYLGDFGWFTNSLPDGQISNLWSMAAIKYQMQEPPVVLAGASTVVGAGTIIYSNTIQTLHRAMPGLRIVSTAFGGIGSGACYTNMLNWITLLPPKSIIYLGSDVALNDALWLNTPLSYSETNILKMAALAHANNDAFLLGSPWSATVWETNSVWNRSNLYTWEAANASKFADKFVDYSSDTNVGPYGACTNNILSYAPLNDGIHPGPLAYYTTVNYYLVPAILNANAPNGGLAISSLSGGNVILTWPTNATVWTLQGTTNLISPVWNSITNSSTVTIGQNEVIIPTSGQGMLFRLERSP